MSILLSAEILFSLHKLRLAKLSSQKAFVLRTLTELGDERAGGS